MSEAALRERIDELEEEVRQLRDDRDHSQTILKYMAAFDLSRRHSYVLYRLTHSPGVTHDSFETIGDGSLKVYIHNIRRKLHRHDIFIHAMWGQGYRMTPENRERVKAIVEAVK